MALLEVHGLSKAFGGVHALKGVDLAIAPGTVHALIGPNGSGKTTLLNCVTGIVKPNAGRLVFRGEALDGLRPSGRTRLGLGRTFQNIRLFGGMSALDNVVAGSRWSTAAAVRAALWHLPFRPAAGEIEARRRARELLSLVSLADRAADIAAALPLAAQRRLEIARALAGDPTLLLLDEPAAGMTQVEKVGLHKLVRQVVADGRTVVLVEHDIALVMEVSDSVTVLNFGEKIAEGPPAAVRRDPRVIEAYLGEEA